MGGKQGLTADNYRLSVVYQMLCSSIHLLIKKLVGKVSRQQEVGRWRVSNNFCQGCTIGKVRMCQISQSSLKQRQICLYRFHNEPWVCFLVMCSSLFWVFTSVTILHGAFFSLETLTFMETMTSSALTEAVGTAAVGVETWLNNVCFFYTYKM